MAKKAEQNKHWEEFKQVIRKNLDRLNKVLDSNNCGANCWDFPLKNIKPKPWYCGLKFQGETSQRKTGLYLHFNTPDKYEWFQEVFMNFINTKSANFDFEIEEVKENNQKVFSNLYFKTKHAFSFQNEYYQWCVDKAIEIGTYLEELKPKLKGSNSSSNRPNLNNATYKISTNSRTIKRGNTDTNEKNLEEFPSDNFRLYGKELTNHDFGIERFPVSEYCEQVRDFGTQPLEIILGPNTYYFTRLKSAESNLYEYHLYRAKHNEDRKGEPIYFYDIAAWPMANKPMPFNGMPEDMPFDPKGKKCNGESMPICGIEKPKFNPQVIILGMNPSETASIMQDTSGTAWKNGYNALANIFLNSALAGGYFTDVIKCYPKTNLQERNSFLKVAKTNDGEIVTDGMKEYKWYELYSLILRNELKKISTIFFYGKRKKFIFLVCGATTYKKILKYKGYNFINILKEYGDIYIMGRHYSRAAPLGNDNSRVESCRRIYDDIAKLNADGKMPTEENDQRGYKYAILEGIDGSLHVFERNSDQLP